MASWNTRQQVKYISTIVLIALALAAYPVYRIFFDIQPTCFDAKQNQNETGIDCGGVCLKVCEAESLNPIVLYTRILEVAPGVYSVVSNIENPNSHLLASNVPYNFKVYDTNNVLIGERDGVTFIPPNKTFPIFEGGINTGNRLPGRIAFEFSNSPVWREATTSMPVLNVINNKLTIATSTERLDAMLQNPTPYNFKDIEVVALLYDSNGNLVAASKTMVDSLPKSKSAPLVFTWPELFNAEVTKTDIVPNIPLEDFIPKQ